MEEGFFKTLFY